MASFKKCDRCGKLYEGKAERMFKTPDGMYVNSVRLGNWNQKTRRWNSLASGYDLCADCASKIYDVVVGAVESEIQMRRNDPKPEKKDIQVEETTEEVATTEADDGK